MHLLVTGASGFIGRPLVHALAAAGHSGLAVSRQTVDGLPPGWHWGERDSILRALLSGPTFDWVIHLEVKQHVTRPTTSDCKEFKYVNVDGTSRWLEWCERSRIPRFAYFSTIKAVGDAPGCQDERSVLPPTTPYGQSKRAAESLVEAWRANDRLRTAIVLRPAVVYGPGNRGNISAMIHAIEHRRFFLIGGGTNIKSLVSVANLAAATSFLVRAPSPGCEIYNVTDLESYSVHDIAAMVARALGRPDRIRGIPVALAKAVAIFGDLAGSVGVNFPLTRSRVVALTETTHFSVAKLKATGFTHPQSTRAGIEELVGWYHTGAASQRR